MDLPPVFETGVEETQLVAAMRLLIIGSVFDLLDTYAVVVGEVTTLTHESRNHCEIKSRSRMSPRKGFVLPERRLIHDLPR